MNTREFSELLKGCRPLKDMDGNIIVQSIMNMQIVCLTTDNEYSLDNRFGNPLTSIKSSNSSYGQMSFVNSNDKEIIIPTQMAVMTKQVAQNHGMIKAGYVESYGNTTYHDAGCVQGSQGGHFKNTSEFRMIPVTMREMLFDSIGKSGGYPRIYPAINKLGNDTNSNTGNYLDKYFDKYDKKLEQFIAHFERPKNLIGVIVLIDGEIVAIDKFPSLESGRRPDFLVLDNGVRYPVECKKVFNRKSLNQLEQYMVEMDVNRGYAVAPKLTIKLPDNIIFIQSDEV